MTRRRFPGPLVIALLIAAVCPHSAHAECHAKDFDVDQLKTVGGAVDDSKENLDALMSAASGTVALLLLGTAKEDADRASEEATMFSVYLLIYRRLTNDADRRTVDDAIRVFAAVIWQSIKKNADSLTVVADKLPQYGAEIRAARDRVRKLQALFSCAADGK
jgi:hypothetical protein